MGREEEEMTDEQKVPPIESNCESCGYPASDHTPFSSRCPLFVAPKPTSSAKQDCKANSRQGWLCSLQKGHEGNHRAHESHDLSDGEILEEWHSSPSTPVSQLVELLKEGGTPVINGIVLSATRTTAVNEALQELKELALEEDYRPDSFTLQPLRKALLGDSTPVSGAQEPDVPEEMMKAAARAYNEETKRLGYKYVICREVITATVRAVLQYQKKAVSGGRIMCADHEWLDERPCPYCAAIKDKEFEEWWNKQHGDGRFGRSEKESYRAAWNASRAAVPVAERVGGEDAKK